MKKLNLMLFLALSLFAISCAKNKIFYGYYGSNVEKCIDYSFSSECVLARGGIDFKTGLPVYLEERPKSAPDVVSKFGFTNQPQILEIESLNEKACLDLGKSKPIYYEIIEKRSNILFGATTSSTLNVWCK